MDEYSLGDRELDVMAVLWEIGSGTCLLYTSDAADE